MIKHQRFHPFDGAKLKLRRAAFHINDFERGIRALANNIEYRIIPEDHPEAPFDFVVEAVNPPDPDEVSPILSDAVSNLRAALDHIAWQLALAELREKGREDETPGRATAFPIYIDRTKFVNNALNNKRGQLQNITKPAVRQVIENFQSCNAENGPHGKNVNRLWVLNQLARGDKHRLPIEIFGGVAVRFSDGSVVESRFPPGSLDQNPGITFRFPEGAEKNFDVRITPTVSFSVRVGRNILIADPMVMRLIHDFIGGEVIPAFEGFVENIGSLK